MLQSIAKKVEQWERNVTWWILHEWLLLAYLTHSKSLTHTLGVTTHIELVCSTLCTRWRYLICKRSTGSNNDCATIRTSTIYSNSSSCVSSASLKLTFRKYPSIHTNYIISHSTILQYNHNIWYGSYLEKKYWTRKTMISTRLHICNLCMKSQGFSPARLAWPAYDGGRKRENSSAWKHRIIVASTCRRSVEFGRYVTWLWMANCVSVMTKMLHLYNFANPCHGRPAWKASQCARATAGSGVWLVEYILLREHVSLRLHWECSLKCNQEPTRSI